MIIWRDREDQTQYIGLDGLGVETLMSHSGTSKCDLTLFLTEIEDEIRLEIEYNTDLFDEARIERLFGHMETILAGAAANSQQSLAETKSCGISNAYEF